MDKWDPRRDDYENTQFNSYVKGPGRNLTANRGKGDKHVQLFVTGIPNEITQEGLLNLFSRAGQVISAKKMTSKREGAGDTFGFVCMANATDAEKAIRDLNNFPIDRFQLRVKVSRNEQDARRRNYQQDPMLMGESSFQDDNDSDNDLEVVQNMAPNGAALNGFGPVPELKNVGRGQMLAAVNSGLYGYYSDLDWRMAVARGRLAAQTRGAAGSGIILSPRVDTKSPGQLATQQLSITIDKDNKRVLSTEGGVGRGITLPHAPLPPHKDYNTDHIGRGGNKSRGGNRCYMRGGYGRGYQESYYDRGNPRRGRGGGGGRGGFMQPYGRGMPYPPPFAQHPMMFPMPMMDPYTYNMMAAGASQHLLQPAYPVMPSPMINAAGAASAQYQHKATTEKKTTSTSTESRGDQSSVISECSVCSKLGELRCSRCKEPYCSRECQARDWPEHRKICKAISNEKEVSAEFSKQFDVSVGDELIPKVKELMEKACGGSFEISRKASREPSRPDRVSESGREPGIRDSDRSGTERNKTISQVNDRSGADRKKMSNGDSDRSGSERRMTNSGDNLDGRGAKKSPGCLNCGSKEHFRKDCKEPIGINQQCFNCKKTGHLSRECPEKPDKDCYNCGNKGHLSKECPARDDNKNNNNNKCYNCNNSGHISRDCPEKSEKKTSKPAEVQQAKRPVPNGNSYTSPPHKPEPGEATGSKTTQIKAQSQHRTTSPPPKKSLATEVLPMHEEAEVVVTEVLDPSTIYVQYINEAKIMLLTQIMAAMAEKYQGSPCDVNNAMTGEIYSCQYSQDQAWYRVQVVRAEGTSVTVHYVDFGNTETTSMASLRQLEPSMMTLPAQAIVCSLEGILPISGSGWNLPTSDIQKYITPNLPYKVTCRKQLDRPSRCKAFEVTMKSKEGKNVGQSMVSAGLAKIKTSSEPGGYQASSFVQSQPAERPVSPSSLPLMVRDLPRVQSTLTLGEELPVFITDATSPVRFTVQVLTDDRIKAYQTFNVQFQALYRQEDTLYKPSVGELVASRFSGDEDWYRGEITAISSPHARVVFIDFGNSEDVDLKVIRKALPICTTVPIQAVYCSLYGVEAPAGDEWPKDALMYVQTLLLQPLMAIVKEVKDGRVGVELYQESEGLISDKVKAFLKKAPPASTLTAAKPTPTATMNIDIANLPLDGDKSEVVISKIVSLSKFYVQLGDAVTRQKHGNMWSALNKFCATAVPYEPQVGEYIAAQYTEGDSTLWYRAKVTEKLDGGAYRAFFIDYGNTETLQANSVAHLDSKFTSFPCMAVPCRLSGCDAVDDARDLKEFENHLEVLSLARAVDYKDEVYSVEIYQPDGTNVNKMILSLAALTIKPATASPIKPDVAKPVSRPVSSPKAEIVSVAKSSQLKESVLPLKSQKLCIVVHIESLSSFCVQIVNEELQEHLGTLVTLNQICEQDATVYKAAVGEYVSAMFTVDSSWYRAKVINKTDGGVEVFFIDFGNTDVVPETSIRKHCQALDAIPSLAVKCSLAGSGGADDATKLEEFNSVLNQAVKVTTVDCADGIYSVRLYTADETETDINQKILSLAGVPAIPATANPIQPDVAKSGTGPMAEIVGVAKPSSQLQETVLPLDATQELCVVVFIESLSSFCVQIVNEELKEFLGTLVTLNQVCEQDETVYKASVGEYVSAMFTVDSSWYRAKVLNKTDGGVEVFFIDFGNTDVVPDTSVRKHCQALDAIPSLAVKCRLAGSGGADDAAKLEEFNSVLNQAVKVKAISQNGDRYVVEMFLMNDEATCVNTVLNLDSATTATNDSPKASNQKQPIEAPKSEDQHSGLPRIEVEQLPLGKPVAAAPMLINSVNDFYVQSADETKQGHLVEILLKLREIYQPSVTPYTPVVGEYVAVLYNDGMDELWYRAQVMLKTGDGQFQLCLIDYGNLIASTTDLIRKLDAKFFTYPWLAFKCRLAGFEIDTEETRKEFSTLALNMEMVMTAKTFESGVYSVDLVQPNGTNIVKNLLSVIGSASACTDIVDQLPKCETPKQEPLPRKQASPSSGERKVVFAQTLAHNRPETDNVTVVITSVVRPNQFHCQIFQEEQSNLQDLKLLTDSMKLDCEHSLSVDDPKFEVGELCCAKFPEDGEWYRATVLEVFPDKTVKVFYVDYGNQCEVPISNLRPIRLEYTVLSLLAFKCTLHGVSPVGASWTQDATCKFKEFENQPLRAKVVKVDADVYELDLEDLKGESVGKQLINAGVATPTKPVAVNAKEAEMSNLQRENEILMQKVNDMQAMMASLLKR